MNHKISFAVLAFSLMSASAFAQDRTWPSYPGENSQPTVTVCDMKVKTYKKAVALCSQYQLDVARAEGTALFECDCSHFGNPGPRGQ